MTKKELNIIKEKFNEAWQELLKHEISLLENGESLERNEYRMNLIFAQTTISDLVRALGLPNLELMDEQTDKLINDVYTLKRNREAV